MLENVITRLFEFGGRIPSCLRHVRHDAVAVRACYFLQARVTTSSRTDFQSPSTFRPCNANARYKPRRYIFKALSVKVVRQFFCDLRKSIYTTKIYFSVREVYILILCQEAAAVAYVFCSLQKVVSLT